MGEVDGIHGADGNRQVGFTDTDATVPFTPPAPGRWTERLDGQASFAAAPGQQVQLTIPSNYGRIWTLG